MSLQSARSFLEHGAKTGTRLFNFYGPTEAVIAASHVEVQRGWIHAADARSVPLGDSVPGPTARAVPVQDAEAGLLELQLGGALADGYVGDEVLTDARFVRDDDGTSRSLGAYHYAAAPVLAHAYTVGTTRLLQPLVRELAAREPVVAFPVTMAATHDGLFLPRFDPPLDRAATRALVSAATCRGGAVVGDPDSPYEVDITLVDLLAEHGRDRLRGLLELLVALPGVPLLYAGSLLEVGNDPCYDPGEPRSINRRRPVTVDPSAPPDTLLAVVRALTVRRGLPGLASGATTRVLAASDGLLWMSRSEGEDRIEVLANVAQSPMAVLVGGDDVLHRTREGATVPAHTTMWVRGT